MKHPVLFGADPIARGKGVVEALSGFFARLCLTRFLRATPVYRRYILERCPRGLFPDHPLRVGTFLSRSSARLDLQPESALPFAAALEDLTFLPDLATLTFSPCAPLLDPASLGHLGPHRKRWCAVCFAAWEADATPLYEPLLWRLALVELCPVHRTRLLDRCPTCNRFQPLITQGYPIGTCVHCKHLLHRSASLLSSDEASLALSDRWSLWRSVALSRLVAWSSTLGRSTSGYSAVSVHGFRRLLEHALEAPPDPSINSRLALACALGQHSSRFYRLLSGTLRPSLQVLLDTCMQLGADPLRVVQGHHREGERSWPSPEDSHLLPCPDPWRFALEVRESCMAQRYPARARALDAFIADPSAVDLAGLMRDHRTTPLSLSTSFPLRHGQARELRAARLERDRAETTQCFNAFLEEEIASGEPRSLTDIAAFLQVPHATLTYYAPERCDELRRLRESKFSTRESGLRERVRAALLAVLAVPEGPTLHDVARSLGVEDFVVLSVCPDEYRLLVELRERERTNRYVGYAAEMRKELASPSPCAPTVLASRLGVARHTLQRADPELHARLAVVPTERAAAKRCRRAAATLARSEELSALRCRLANALERELRTPFPRSPRAVALEEGVPPSNLRHHCRQLYDRLLDLRAARRNEFLETVRSALEEEISSSTPRALTPFARAHGVAPETLASSFPDLVAQLRIAIRRAPRVARPRLPRPGDARLLAVLEAEAKSDTPRSLRALARSLGVSTDTLSRVSRPAVERLLALRA